MKLLGIYREPEFSPGRHASNDARILRLVGHALERDGAEIRLATLEEARALRGSADLIFSMCQGPRALAELADWKEEGLSIVNDPEASRRTYRDSLCSASQEKNLGFPHSMFLQAGGVPARAGLDRLFAQGAWLKRADVHATQPSDVVYLQKFEDLAPALAAFRSRGLLQAVLQEHRQGDEVKFYAVRGGRLFWPFYPKDCEGYPFDEKELERLAEHAAQVLGVGVYGGDAIVSPDGHITLIDLNDWPSFAPCRGAAAHAIAGYLKDVFHALKHELRSPVSR